MAEVRDYSRVGPGIRFVVMLALYCCSYQCDYIKTVIFALNSCPWWTLKRLGFSRAASLVFPPSPTIEWPHQFNTSHDPYQTLSPQHYHLDIP
jgi:hypothetical protein